jgi:VWFA-related protein
MRTGNLIVRSLLFCALAAACIAAQTQTAKAPPKTSGKAKVNVPARPNAALFQGEQGNQKTEVSFNPSTRMVTLKMLVQDPNGYFIPNIRRENFAVYEDGVRQRNATVDIEHSPVTLAVLLEWGGRYLPVSKALGDQIPRATRQIFDELGPHDKIAVFRYAGKVEKLADFSADRQTLNGLFAAISRPEFSERNFYDALISTVDFMKNVQGRKAIVVISSGVDTFSKATWQDALDAARNGGTPIYALDIGPALRNSLAYSGVDQTGPYARIDWKGAESRLQQIAQASGGRMYPVQMTFNLASAYDDMMENLRLRYVISYKSTAAPNATSARSIRVDLIDPETGGPLQIVDSNGKTVSSRLSFEAGYTPSIAAVSESR